MLDLLQRLKTRKAESEITRRDQWLGLVQVVAHDDPPDDDNLLTTLEDCGKSLDELEAAVELVKRREAWATQIEAAPGARAELVQLNQQQAAAKAVLDEAAKAYDEVRKSIGELARRAQQIVDQADLARRELQGSSTCPELKARIQAAQDKSREVQPRLQQLLENRGDERTELQSMKDAAEYLSKPPTRGIAHAIRNVNAADIERQEARIKDIDSKIEPLEEIIRQATADADEARRLQLEPLAI